METESNMLHSFEEFINEMKKEYGHKMKVEDFSKLKEGDLVKFDGFTHKVIEPGKYVITIVQVDDEKDKKDDAPKKKRRPKKVNLGMFNDRGQIN